MPNRVRFRFGLHHSAAFVLTALVAFAADSARAEAPRLDVAFVLDTTGSMGAYIEEAQARIRAISDELAEGDPRPDVRFALVEFRDRNDAFVTRVHPFSGDLSVMRGYLDGASASGGGDHPEAVLEGTKAAIDDLAWTPLTGDTRAVRLLFLVGDAPPQHYGPTLTEDTVARAARDKGIVIHSIVCGSGVGDSAMGAFERLARHTEGRAFELGQSRRAIAGGVRRASPSLGAMVAGATRAYSSSAGVAYAPGSGTRVAVETASVPVLAESGLLGPEVRWVRDAATFSDLWAVHTSLLPQSERPPLPEVDFAHFEVLVIGGRRGGLRVDGIFANDGRRRVEVRSEEAAVKFVFVSIEGGAR